MINYKHLHYFWMVAREGSIARACDRLHLTPQTVSGQLALLEENLGVKLFERVGRKLEPSDIGRLVLSYADEIFSLGNELEDSVRNLPEQQRIVFRIGIADVVPKSITYRLVAPAMQLPTPVRIICRENTIETLLAELAVHHVDLVIADGPIPPGINVKGFNHPLGECGVTFLAVPEIARRLRKDFPRSLDGEPMLLPGENTLVRGQLLDWLESQHIYPRIVGEFEDSALMKAFGQNGAGVFISPTPIASEVEKQYGVSPIGSTDRVLAKFYAISVERKISHPAIAAITQTAREWLTTTPTQKPVRSGRNKKL